MTVKKNKTTKIRFTAEVESPDGGFTRTVEVSSDEIPALKDFDLSTKEGFLRDFDKLEKAVLNGRNQIGKEVAEGFLDEAGKKNRSAKEKNAK